MESEVFPLEGVELAVHGADGVDLLRDCLLQARDRSLESGDELVLDSQLLPQLCQLLLLLCGQLIANAHFFSASDQRLRLAHALLLRLLSPSLLFFQVRRRRRGRFSLILLAQAGLEIIDDAVFDFGLSSTIVEPKP